ncbi:alcohol dehydrogenase [Caballeronia calidae]|uniref:Alcohol dehydrogenase n=2 Tax=Caballeronia calidae TaxID=1777139 RepID=A0A158CMY3_9BURK|nr:alcohol dehydrogenase [Caballeronia calidae]
MSVIPTLDMSRCPTYGEVINIPARYVVKHPARLTFEQAAASWMQYVTAWGALIAQGKLSADDFVIVSAASSSVGIAAIQIARSVGATVIATTEEDLATRVRDITNGKAARVVFDPIGGPAIAQLAECMSFGGILLEYGALSTDEGTFPQFALLGKCLTFKGYLYIEVTSSDELLERAKAFINEKLESGALVPLISRTFEFDEIREATRFLESNEQVGKIVVTVD